MFTGIIEKKGIVTGIKNEGSNIHFIISSDISSELKIDQSVAHDGVCLTVVEVGAGWHRVTAIEETLFRSNLSSWKVGGIVNLERAMLANARLDGHLVQGHVDTTGICTQAKTLDGSWIFSFQYTANPDYLLVDKGSVCINGVSLTVVNPSSDKFSVAIIPYTFEHTNFQELNIDSVVNLEFDIVGKYIARHLKAYQNFNK